jgi:hypothetical protein
MARPSAASTLILAVIFFTAICHCQSSSEDIKVEGNVLAQLKVKMSRHEPKQPKLKYAPVKYLDGCPPVGADFGPHPNAGPVKGLGQHLQVATEVSCTNFFLRCAYATKDFSLLAEAIASGLLATDELQHDQELLMKGIASGASAVHQKGINSRVDQQEEFVKCKALPPRDIQIKGLREAIQRHFQAYEATPALFSQDPSLADGIALAFCDQIGDTGNSPCNDLMSKAIRSHYGGKK